MKFTTFNKLIGEAETVLQCWWCGIQMKFLLLTNKIELNMRERERNMEQKGRRTENVAKKKKGDRAIWETIKKSDRFCIENEWEINWDEDSEIRENCTAKNGHITTAAVLLNQK